MKKTRERFRVFLLRFVLKFSFTDDTIVNNVQIKTNNTKEQTDEK